MGLLRPGAFVSGSTKAAASNGLHAQLVLLIAGQICIHAAMAGMRMAAPLLAMTQGYGKASIGALVALFAVTQIFLALPAGRLADRHGIKRPIALSVVAASIGIGSAALWPIYDRYRDRFVALRADCAPGRPVAVTLEEVTPAPEPSG